MWEIAVTLVLSIVVILLAVLSFKLDEKYLPIKLLFFFLCFLIIILGLYTCVHLGTDAGASSSAVSLLKTGYLVVLWSGIFILIYSVIIFIQGTVVQMNLKKRGEIE